MARDMWEMSEMQRVFNEDNKILQAALEALQDGTYEKKLKQKMFVKPGRKMKYSLLKQKMSVKSEGEGRNNFKMRTVPKFKTGKQKIGIL